ncbi:hypothetical protein ACLOJK_003699 [Asimina triloba]
MAAGHHGERNFGPPIDAKGYRIGIAHLATDFCRCPDMLCSLDSEGKGECCHGCSQKKRTLEKIEDATAEDGDAVRDGIAGGGSVAAMLKPTTHCLDGEDATGDDLRRWSRTELVVVVLLLGPDRLIVEKSLHGNHGCHPWW